MRRDVSLQIDVLDSCNLTCPSCPVGNMANTKDRVAFMEPEFLNKIMLKASKECHISSVALYNWTEPLIHPKIAELVRIVRSFGVPCCLSSNLNRLKGVEQLLAAEPSELCISVSGFNQENYGETHRGGNIEYVKNNMRLLAKAIRNTGSQMPVTVRYLKYLHNADDEVQMKEFSESLGFSFTTLWAVMLPLEKVLAFINDDPSYAILTEEDFHLIDQLALPLREAINASQKFKHEKCSLLHDLICMDFRGDVHLCCAVYDSSRYKIKNFLTTPLEEIQNLRLKQEICSSCTDRGIHKYFTFEVPEFEEIYKRNMERRKTHSK